MDQIEVFVAAHGGVITSAEARELGLPSWQLRVLERGGHLRAVCRGAFAAASWLDQASPEEAHRIRVRAVLRSQPESFAASHLSAAVLLGLPCLAADLARVHVVRRHSTSGSGRRLDAYTVHEHSGPQDFREVDGVWTVGPVAAVLGSAAVGGPITAQAVVDAALRGQVVGREELVEGLAGWKRHSGVVQARRAVELGDGRSESVGESGLRPVLVALGHVVVPQALIIGAVGQVVARVDFLLPALGVVVEFDGALKYEGHAGRDALVREKRREDQIRALGYAVVRVTWAMLFAPAELRAEIDVAARAATRTVA